MMKKSRHRDFPHAFGMGSPAFHCLFPMAKAGFVFYERADISNNFVSCVSFDLHGCWQVVKTVFQHLLGE